MKIYGIYDVETVDAFRCNIENRYCYSLYKYLDKLPSNYCKYSMQFCTKFKRMINYHYRINISEKRTEIGEKLKDLLFRYTFSDDNNTAGYYHIGICKKVNYDQDCGWDISSPMRIRKIKLGSNEIECMREFYGY